MPTRTVWAPWLLLLASCAGRGWDPVDLAALPKAESYPENRLLILLDEVHVRFLVDSKTGRAVFDETSRRRFQILRETETLDDVAIHHDPVFHQLVDVRARVIRPDGTERFFGRPDGRDELASSSDLFTDNRRFILELGMPPVGSVVEWEYSMRHTEPIVSVALQTFRLHSPIRIGRLVVDVPSGWEIEATPRGVGAPTARLEQVGDLQRHVWEAIDQPGMRSEELEGYWEEPQVTVRLSRWTENGAERHAFRDARELSAWAEALHGTPAPLDAEMRATLDGLLAGAPADPMERSRRVYEWVRDEIQYCSVQVGWGGWKPQEPAKVMRARYGDCKAKANLLHVLLLSAGIQSRNTLVHHHDGVPQPFRLELGMMNFDHQILTIDLPQGALVCDPTAQVPFGELPLSDQEAELLPLTVQGSSVVRAPGTSPDENSTETTLDLSVGKNGGAQGTVVHVARGGPASRLAHHLRYAGERDRADLVADLLWLPDDSIEDLQIGERHRHDEDLRLQATVKTMHAGSPAGSILLLRISDARARWLPVLPDEPRRTPIALGDPTLKVEHLRYRLPEGARPGVLPVPVSVAIPGLAYSLTWRSEAGVLVADRTLRLTQRQLPVESYAEVRQAVGRMHAAESQGVVVEWSP